MLRIITHFSFDTYLSVIVIIFVVFMRINYLYFFAYTVVKYYVQNIIENINIFLIRFNLKQTPNS